MLTLMQCMLLPPRGEEVAWFHLAIHVLRCFLDGQTASARTAAAAVMLQPFVMQLLPAGLSALKAAAAAAEATGPTSSGNSSTAAVTAPMPAQPSFDNAALVLNSWLSTGDACSIDASAAPSFQLTLPRILCRTC
jgi:hypothetical protein